MAPEGRRRERRRERGSVLMLLPAAVLAMFVLAAIAVDVSIAFMAQRELTLASSAAANDAATLALSDDAFYREGRIATDPARLAEIAEERVRASVDTGRIRNLVVEAEAIAPSGAACSWTVVVRVRGEVDHFFARALPGGSDRTTVAAAARASPREDERSC